MYDYFKKKTEPEKAEALAKASLNLMRLNIDVAGIDFNHSDEDYDEWSEKIKTAEKEMFYRFEDATGRKMYRVGRNLFVAGVKV